MTLMETIEGNIAQIVISLSVFTLLLSVCVIFLFSSLVKTKRLYRAFSAGKSGKSLESSILSNFKRLQMLEEKTQDISKDIHSIQEEMNLKFTKCGLVRFNAFSEMGGQLSFAVALLDNRNSGFVINSIHSREGCYTYAKEVIDGTSYIDLSEEEKQALEHAIGGLRV